MVYKDVIENVCSTKDGRTAEGPLSQISRWIYRHSILILIFTFVVLLLLPFLIVALIKEADVWFPRIQFTRLTDGTNIWLSFWGSYLGCVATVILSMGAILINEKINRYTWHKNMVDQIGEFNNFEVRSIALYHLDRSFPEKLLARLSAIDHSAKFAVLVTFQNPFPPHYSVDISDIRICKDYSSLDEGAPVEAKFTSLISNCNRTEFLFLSDNDALKEFYCFPLTGKNTAWEEKHYWLRFRLKCDNQLYTNGKEYYQPLQVVLNLWLFNDGIVENNSAKIEIEKRKIFCEVSEE